MTVSNATFSDVGSSVSDIFAGMGAQAQGALQAEGLQLQAQGTEISSQSTQITAQGLRTQAAGNIAEATTYNEAAGLASENAAYTAQSTRIQQAQQQRTETQTIGSQRAAEAGAGFSSGGTAFYLMKDSANQGALATGVIGAQGAITQAGYNEQASSYTTMAKAGEATAAAEETMAGETDTISTEQQALAGQQDQLATATQNAANSQATGDFVGALVQGAAAAGSLFLGNPAPAIAAVMGGAKSAVGDPNGIGGLY